MGEFESLLNVRKNDRRSLGKTYLGDTKFEPIWAELDKADSVVFVHPADTVMPPNLPFGPCR